MGKRSGEESGKWSKKKKAKMYYQKQARQEGRGRGRGGGGGPGRGSSRGGGHGHGSNSNFSGKRSQLELGMKGFLCSCNFNEKDCVKESQNLLNEYFDREIDVTDRRPNEDLELKAGTDTEEGRDLVAAVPRVAENDYEFDHDQDDVEKALRAEIKQLMSNENINRFKSVFTDVQNLVFISTTVQNPALLAHRILDDIFKTKTQKSKFLLRMIPIETVCRANMDDLNTTFRTLVPKFFPSGQISSYQIVFKSRCNGKILREGVIKLLAEIIHELNPLCVVDLSNNSQQAVIIEVIKNKICIGIAKNYGALKKYNLLEVAGVSTENADKCAKKDEVATASGSEVNTSVKDTSLNADLCQTQADEEETEIPNETQEPKETENEPVSSE